LVQIPPPKWRGYTKASLYWLPGRILSHIETHLNAVVGVLTNDKTFWIAEIITAESNKKIKLEFITVHSP